MGTPVPPPTPPIPTPPSSRPSTSGAASTPPQQQQHQLRESSRTMKPSSKNITRVHIRSRSISPATPLTPSLFHYSTHQLTNQRSSPPTLMPRSDSFDRLRGRNYDDHSDAESHISVYNTRTPKRPNRRRDELLQQQRRQQEEHRRHLDAEKVARQREVDLRHKQLVEKQRDFDEQRKLDQKRNYEQMLAYQKQQAAMSRQVHERQQQQRPNHFRSRTIGSIQPIDLERQRSIAERWARINQISNNYDKQLIMPKYQKCIH